MVRLDVIIAIAHIIGTIIGILLAVYQFTFWLHLQVAGLFLTLIGVVYYFVSSQRVTVRE